MPWPNDCDGEILVIFLNMNKGSVTVLKRYLACTYELLWYCVLDGSLALHCEGEFCTVTCTCTLLMVVPAAEVRSKVIYSEIKEFMNGDVVHVYCASVL